MKSKVFILAFLFCFSAFAKHENSLGRGFTPPTVGNAGAALPTSLGQGGYIPSIAAKSVASGAPQATGSSAGLAPSSVSGGAAPSSVAAAGGKGGGGGSGEGYMGGQAKPGGGAAGGAAGAGAGAAGNEPPQQDPGKVGDQKDGQVGQGQPNQGQPAQPPQPALANAGKESQRAEATPRREPASVAAVPPPVSVPVTPARAAEPAPVSKEDFKQKLADAKELVLRGEVDKANQIIGTLENSALTPDQQTEVAIFRESPPREEDAKPVPAEEGSQEPAPQDPE